jgi:hypothetical protein
LTAVKAGSPGSAYPDKVNAQSAFERRTPIDNMSFAKRRLAREWKTVSAMLRIYCHDHHGASRCEECEGLARYVSLRLERCRFGEDKPTCVKCPVHCYQRDRRDQIKVVMRYAGPRMLWHHPWLSLWHLLDGRLRRPVTSDGAADT